MKLTTPFYAMLFAYGAVASNVNGALQAAAAKATMLSSQVVNYNSHKGIQGALSIQYGYEALASEAHRLQIAVEGSSPDDYDTPTVALVRNYYSVTSALLDALSRKAADFTEVGVKAIVAGDLSGLAEPDAAIFQGIFDKNRENCSVVSALKPGFESLTNALNSAARIYNVQTRSFQKPYCVDNGTTRVP